MSAVDSAARRQPTLRELLHDLGCDIARCNEHAAAFSGRQLGPLRRLSLCLTPPILCCVLYRISHWFYCRGWSLPGLIAARANRTLFKATINPGSIIGPGLYIPHTVGIVFQGQAERDLTLYHAAMVVAAEAHQDDYGLPAACPTLGARITVGAAALVQGAVSIGSDTLIGPHAVVTADVPPVSLVTDGCLNPHVGRGSLAPRPAQPPDRSIAR
jgi:serine O-acetyltransferase